MAVIVVLLKQASAHQEKCWICVRVAFCIAGQENVAKRVPLSPTRERPAPASKKRSRTNGASPPDSGKLPIEPLPKRFSGAGVAADPSDSPSLEEKLHAQIEQIGKAVSIIRVCHQACASLVRMDDEEYMVPALVTVMDLLGAVMSQLEAVCHTDAESAV